MALRQGASSLLRQLAAAPLESSLSTQAVELLGCGAGPVGVEDVGHQQQQQDVLI
jgi:hypothetical protein